MTRPEQGPAWQPAPRLMQYCERRSRVNDSPAASFAQARSAAARISPLSAAVRRSHSHAPPDQHAPSGKAKECLCMDAAGGARCAPMTPRGCDSR